MIATPLRDALDGIETGCLFSSAALEHWPLTAVPHFARPPETLVARATRWLNAGGWTPWADELTDAAASLAVAVEEASTQSLYPDTGRAYPALPIAEIADEAEAERVAREHRTAILRAVGVLQDTVQTIRADLLGEADPHLLVLNPADSGGTLERRAKKTEKRQSPVSPEKRDRQAQELFEQRPELWEQLDTKQQLAELLGCLPSALANTTKMPCIAEWWKQANERRLAKPLVGPRPVNLNPIGRSAESGSSDWVGGDLIDQYQDTSSLDPSEEAALREEQELEDKALFGTDDVEGLVAVPDHRPVPEISLRAMVAERRRRSG